MGLNLSTNGELTDNQKKRMEKMGLTEEQMINKLMIDNGTYKYPISIIIPVYNAEKYIEQCVRSALSQTITCEVIVVDDGSTDGTLDVLKQINSITVLVKSNGGTASALNTGIRNSKGDWIKWLSADDVLYPEYAKKLMDYISTTPNNKNKIYYTNYMIIDSDGNFINYFIEPPQRNFMTNDEQFEELLRYYYGNGSSSLIHRETFEKIGYFDESLPYFEDYDFWLRAGKNGMRFELINESLLKYRRHEKQMTNIADNSLAETIKEKYR